jgi:4-amino-4-deoxy-L-arabinose transferase-like glycosyltransferase
MGRRSALLILIAIAALRLALHTATNGQYGFHRDELATLDDARHLDWGFVAYPPLTPFFARISLAFGDPEAGPTCLRFFAALAQSIAMVIAGLMAREFGGSVRAQIIAALAVFAAPVSMVAGHLFQYVTFDFLWQVLTVYFVVRMVGSENPRWWLAIGASIGLGVLTRYTIAWLVAGLVVGFLATPARKLFGWWTLAGAAVTIAMAMPHLVWQARHDFLALEFLRSIHERDVRIGRGNGFLWKQFVTPAASLTVPLWIAGLVFFFRRQEGRRFRLLGWTFAAALALFAAAQARDYYSAPLYPMLLAAGAVVADGWSPWAQRLNAGAIAVSLCVALLLLPVAPAGSAWFRAALKVNDGFAEEIGWQEFTRTVARIRDSLPDGERANAGILAGNYGEAGAIALYGGRYGLPAPLSRVNSFWVRGYGERPPSTLIVTGVTPSFVDKYFQACESRGTITNALGVANEETERHKYLWVCRGLREPWPVFWKNIRAFG